MNDTFLFNPDLSNRLYERYLRLVATINSLTENIASNSFSVVSPISKRQLEIFIESAFWASLKREEGRFHNFKVSFLRRKDCLFSYALTNPIPLNANTLAKTSPAINPLNNKICVEPILDDNVNIWGFASIKGGIFPEIYITCDVISPGQILISFKESNSFGFSFFISGERIEFVKTSEFLHWLNSKDSINSKKEHIWKAADYRTILEKMRSHNHGGTLLIVEDTEEWKKSIRYPILYLGEDSLEIIISLKYRNKLFIDERRKNKYYSHLEYQDVAKSAQNSLGVVGELTAIDGATIMTKDFKVLAFGAKIEAKSKPDEILISEPFENSKIQKLELSKFNGTRHQSAAQFVHEQNNAIAIVASQDGKVSIMKGNENKNTVSVISPAEFALI